MAEGGPESEVRGRGRGREMKFGPLVIWSTLGQSCPLPPLPPPRPPAAPDVEPPAFLFSGRAGLVSITLRLN